MSITVTLYTFSKRENSTAQPSTGTDFYCVLKQPTSIINPTLEISASDITGYNYAYIAAFGRYYFMKDITSGVNYNEKLNNVKLETFKTTDEVIKKQMRVAQEIASLLGETTAETKVALLNLKKTLQGEEEQ